jgi:peptidoglycan/LPS O-acetylase OafA/YrhL
VDPRFFEYLIIFVAGIYVSRYPSANAWMYNAHPAVVVPLALISAWLYGLCEVARLPVQSWQFLFSVVLFIITWISIALRLFRRAGPSLAFWIPISTASFFAYLLHRPIWAILESQIVVEPGVQRALFRLIPGTIVVMILCYFLQRGYDGLLVRLKHLKPGNPPMHSSRTG